MEKGLFEQELKEIILGLVERIGIVATIDIYEADDLQEADVLVCNIQTQESNFLIGQNGLNLQALQHITRIIVRKKIQEPINFVLDVNNYRQEKNNSIVKLAKTLAEQAVAERRTIILRPMTAYERRFVHLELIKNEQVRTESIGEGADRRVVIKPLNMV